MLVAVDLALVASLSRALQIHHALEWPKCSPLGAERGELGVAAEGLKSAEEQGLVVIDWLVDLLAVGLAAAQRVVVQSEV